MRPNVARRFGDFATNSRCYDIDVNAIQSLAMYVQNSQVIEALLTHGVSKVRFQATK